MAPDFDAVPRMRRERELERKAVRVASFRPVLPPRPPAEAAPAPVEGPRVYVYVEIQHGDGAADPGTIQEGHYTITGNVVRVEDMEGRSLGTQALRPGESAATVAKQILRRGCPISSGSRFPRAFILASSAALAPRAGDCRALASRTRRERAKFPNDF
jgi:hypothetical protein